MIGSSLLPQNGHSLLSDAVDGAFSIGTLLKRAGQSYRATSYVTMCYDDSEISSKILDLVLAKSRFSCNLTSEFLVGFNEKALTKELKDRADYSAEQRH